MAHGVPPASAAWSTVADVTGIGKGTTVLDIGCGTGGFCRLAAGRGALVHGADADPERIVAARRAVPEAELRVARLERLPWPDGSFDVVTGFNAFQYAADVDGALEEARRVARSSGRVAVCKWGPPATNEFFSFLGMLEPFRFRLTGAARDLVDSALERLQVTVVAAGEVPCAISLGDGEALATALVSAGARAEPDHGEAWRTRVAAAAAPFRQEDGSYRFENHLVYRVFAASASAGS